MSDLIYRQAAIDAVMRNACNTQRIYEAIKGLPSAQTYPKKGKWIETGRKFEGGYFWIRCSECGCRDINAPTSRTNFCPWCGADMRGGDAE